MRFAAPARAAPAYRRRPARKRRERSEVVCVIRGVGDAGYDGPSLGKNM